MTSYSDVKAPADLAQRPIPLPFTAAVRQFSRAATLIKAAEPKLQIVFNPNEGTSNNGTIADASTLFVDGKAMTIRATSCT